MESIIAALQEALEKNPQDCDLRLHIAGLLLEQGDMAGAGEHYDFVLARKPADIAALKGAAQVATARGDTARAEDLHKLLSALGHAVAAADDSEGDAVTADTDAGTDVPPALRVVADGAQDNVTVGPWEDTDPPVTLADVGGMAEVKERINKAFLAPMKNPELRRMFGKSLRGGMLLYGPPGCGKTFIARALAGEIGAAFMSIGLSDVLDMWLGESERKLHEIFETARRKSPAVLFFDEIDALGQKRSHLRHSAGRNIVNQLLAEMDSMEGDNRNVFVLAATNHPWDVDSALRRPGRFDRTVFVTPPDGEAREQILHLHLRERPVRGVEPARLATMTDGYSGADLAHLCETAAEHAMHDSIESGTVREVNMADFERALAEVRPSTRAWFETARNFAMFANEGGVYDPLLDYIRQHKL